MKTLFIILAFSISTIGNSQGLTIIDQDFEEARKIANQENKLLFIDFYTTWCGPCKKLDKYIFRNDTLSQKLKNNFVLLKYDAEHDKKFNLSKKYHVSSYPTAIVLNSEGRIVNRQYGFSGENVQELSASVFKFTKASIKLNQQNKIQKGYSNIINLEKYPQFYIDFVNRDDTKVEVRQDFNDYWKKENVKLSEEYFSTLFYFADKIPSSNMDDFLKNKEKYIERFGQQDVDITLFQMINGRFKNAINKKSEKMFEVAIDFMRKIMTKEEQSMFLPSFEKRFGDATSE